MQIIFCLNFVALKTFVSEEDLFSQDLISASQTRKIYHESFLAAKLGLACVECLAR